MNPENHKSGEIRWYRIAENSIAATIAITKARVASKARTNDDEPGPKKFTRKKIRRGPRSISSLPAPCGSCWLVIRAAGLRWRERPRADRTGGGRRPSR